MLGNLDRLGFHSLLLGLPHDNAVFAFSSFEHNFPHKSDNLKLSFFWFKGVGKGQVFFCTNTINKENKEKEFGNNY